MTKRYIGVDPGLITGIAVYEPGVRFASYEHTRGQIMGMMRQLVRAEDVVIVERYVISAQTIKKTRQNDAMQIIGAVRELCRERQAQCIIQEPAPAKRIGNNAVLKMIKWYRLTKDNHANDAASLVLMGLLKTNGAEYARLLNL